MAREGHTQTDVAEAAATLPSGNARTAGKIDHSLIAAMLSRYGIQDAGVRRVAHLGCEVYRIRPRACSRDASIPVPGDLAWRVYASPVDDLAAIESEMLLMRSLTDAGLHAPRPLIDRDGQTIQSLPAVSPGIEPARAVLVTLLPGRLLEKGLGARHLHRLGAMTARLHNVSQALAQAGHFQSTRPAYVPDLLAWRDGRVPRTPFISPATYRAVRRAAGVLHEAIAAFPVGAGAFGFVHGDLHLWNVLFHHGAAGAIDFSDCGWGHHALDLAATLQYLKHPLHGRPDHSVAYPHLREQLLAGYASVRPLPPDIEPQIDAYIAARMISTIEWIAEEWPRPDHRAWGPAFLAGAARLFDAYLQS